MGTDTLIRVAPFRGLAPARGALNLVRLSVWTLSTEEAGRGEGVGEGGRDIAMERERECSLPSHSRPSRRSVLPLMQPPPESCAGSHSVRVTLQRPTHPAIPVMAMCYVGVIALGPSRPVASESSSSVRLGVILRSPSHPAASKPPSNASPARARRCAAATCRVSAKFDMEQLPCAVLPYYAVHPNCSYFHCVCESDG